MGGHFVRIRIYWIIGFSGFRRLVFDAASGLPIFVLSAFSCFSEKRELDEVKS